MAVGDETIGFGGTLEVNDGVADAYVVVPMIVSLGLPQDTVGTVESKRLDLPNRRIIYLPTLVDGGEVSIRIQHTNAGYARFAALRDAYTEKNFKFTIPDDDGDTVITVPGIVTAARHDPLEAETITVFEVVVRVTGVAA